MAGAFVGVADDATAVYWNPAGLATGALASFTFDYGIDDTFSDAPDLVRAGHRDTAGIIALAVPPLGLTYYRLAEYAAAPPEAAVAAPDGPRRIEASSSGCSHHDGRGNSSAIDYRLLSRRCHGQARSRRSCVRLDRRSGQPRGPSPGRRAAPQRQDDGRLRRRTDGGCRPRQGRHGCAKSHDAGVRAGRDGSRGRTGPPRSAWCGLGIGMAWQFAGDRRRRCRRHASPGGGWRSSRRRGGRRSVVGETAVRGQGWRSRQHVGREPVERLFGAVGWNRQWNFCRSARRDRCG